MKKISLTILSICFLSILLHSCSKEEVQPELQNNNKFVKTSYEAVYDNIRETIYIEYEENGARIKLSENNSEGIKKFIAKNGNTLSAFVDEKNTVYYYESKEAMHKAHNINIDLSLMKESGQELAENKRLKSIWGATGFFMKHPNGYNTNADIAGHSLNQGNAATGYATIPWVGGDWNDCITAIGSRINNNKPNFLILLFSDANYGGHNIIITRGQNSLPLDLRSVFRFSWLNWDDCTSSVLMIQQ